MMDLKDGFTGAVVGACSTALAFLTGIDYHIRRVVRHNMEPYLTAMDDLKIQQTRIHERMDDLIEQQSELSEAAAVAAERYNTISEHMAWVRKKLDRDL